MGEFMLSMAVACLVQRNMPPRQTELSVYCAFDSPEDVAISFRLFVLAQVSLAVLCEP